MPRHRGLLQAKAIIHKQCWDALFAVGLKDFPTVCHRLGDAHEDIAILLRASTKQTA